MGMPGITTVVTARRSMASQRKFTAQICPLDFSPESDPRSKPNREQLLPSIINLSTSSGHHYMRHFLDSTLARPVRQFLSHVRFISCSP